MKTKLTIYRSTNQTPYIVVLQAGTLSPAGTCSNCSLESCGHWKDENHCTNDMRFSCFPGTFTNKCERTEGGFAESIGTQIINVIFVTYLERTRLAACSI